MPSPRILVTGFEPYGDRTRNPAQDVMRQLDGRSLDGSIVVGRSLPVTFDSLTHRIRSLLHDVEPDTVISLGLWPGESTIRIERAAFNIADFAIADNAGHRVRDKSLSVGGPAAMMATIPVRAIETALLQAGIPAQISNSAGTFLCNACLYGFLEAAAHMDIATTCGFLHLPYLPEQVAELLVRQHHDATGEIQQCKDLASMSLDMSVRAVELAIIACCKSPAARGGFAQS